MTPGTAGRAPYFEKPEAERMSAWLSELGNGLVYDAATDTFTTTYDSDAPESFTGTDIDGMHLYPIDNGSWTWAIVDEVSAPKPASPDNSQ